jgi:hypothetical protein
MGRSVDERKDKAELGDIFISSEERELRFF